MTPTGELEILDAGNDSLGNKVSADATDRNYSDGSSAIDLSSRLTREERIEIVLMSGERSNRVIAADFNARHPTRPPISHATVNKLLAKFRETGSLFNLPKCGRMKSVTNEETFSNASNVKVVGGAQGNSGRKKRNK